nr:unnamed protein product [Callosobruchus analis]
MERCFGKWKSRFRCLQRGITTKVETALVIICATAVLHNLAQPGIDDANDDDNIGCEALSDFIINNPEASALAYRRAFIITHFA